MTVEIPPGPMVIGMAMGTTAMAFHCGGLVAHFDVLLNGYQFWVWQDYRCRSLRRWQSAKPEYRRRLERAHADTEYFQQDTAAQRKDDNHDENC